MEFTYIADGIDAVVIDNFYNEAQLKEIHDELIFLTKPSIMVDDKDKLESATDNTGKFLTEKYGVWVDTVFNNWRHSSLISHAITNFSNKETREKIISFNPLYKIFYHCNVRHHLLSYYENGGYYKKHVDSSVFTVLNYFNIEPKQFSGGEIILYSDGELKKASIEPINGRVVIIPSCVVHEVTPIHMTTKNTTLNTINGNGRYCCSIFLSAQTVKEHNDIS